MCEQYGIQFIETEESYTSQASFLDGDYLPIYGEKPHDWKPSGRRTMRGLYRTADSCYINADCNGSANILRKVSRTLKIDFSRLSRGALTRPQRIKLWSVNKKKRMRPSRRFPPAGTRTKQTFENAVLTRSQTSLLESPVF